MIKEYFAFVSGVGTGKSATMSAIRKGNRPPVSIKLTKNDQLVVYNDETNNKIGNVLSMNDPIYDPLVTKEPKTNEVMSAEQLYDILKTGREVTGFAVSTPSATSFKISFEIDEDEKETPKNKTGVKEKEILAVDLSSFDQADQKSMKQRIEYIKTLAMEESVKEKVINAFVKFMSSHTNIPAFESCFVNTNQIVETAIKNVLAGSNLCLTGPKGTGKNKMVEHICRLFDLVLCDMQMSYDTAKEEVRGEPTIGETGKVEMRLSNILMAAQKPSVICLDEANMARGSITSLLHSATDHRRYMEVPGFGVVHVHPQARFIITMNEGDEYEGTREMNSAFRDRFHEIVFKPSADHMASVFEQECGLGKEQSAELSKFYKLMHDAVYNAEDEGIPSEYLSQRKFVRAGQMLAMGFVSSVQEAVSEEIVETIADSDVRGVLNTMFMLHI